MSGVFYYPIIIRIRVIQNQTLKYVSTDQTAINFKGAVMWIAFAIMVAML
mgnify:CR=1 FL=1